MVRKVINRILNITISFPIQQENEHGYYDVHPTPDKSGRCPECGECSFFSRMDYCILRCNHCNSVWRDMGKYGFQELDRPKRK